MDNFDKDEFQALARPLIEWLNKNAHPHASIVVRTDGAEILEGRFGFQTDEFIKD